MTFTLMAAALAAGLFAGMVLLLEVGRRAGRRRIDSDEKGAREGLGVVEGAVFGLFGLLLAFTFAGAAQRFDARRSLITTEANAIGTAWLRLDMLPAESQPPMRDHFRTYFDQRLEAYALLPDLDAAMSRLEDSGRTAKRLWADATAACRTAEASSVSMLVLPALNEMFDVAEERLAISKQHPPTVIFVMLYVLAFGVALFAGHAMSRSKERSWVHVIGFCLAVAATFYVIIDLEYPRLGLIRVDAADQILHDLRETMK